MTREFPEQESEDGLSFLGLAVAPLKGASHRKLNAEESPSDPTPEPVLAPVGRMHRAPCRQSIDEWGDRWHSAACEGGASNYRYALAFSGDKRYARSIAAWVTP